jgi:hypothetical protein
MEDFRPSHVLKSIWDIYIQHMMSGHFLQQSQSDLKNRAKEIHGFITTHTNGSILFVLHAKRMVKLCFIR